MTDLNLEQGREVQFAQRVRLIFTLAEASR